MSLSPPSFHGRLRRIAFGVEIANRCARFRDWTDARFLWHRTRVIGPGVHRVRGSVAALILALFCVPALTVEGEGLPFDEPVVPPGQNKLLAEMLGQGAALPDDCKFTGGGADGPIIRGNYTCPSGAVVFELVYPDNAPAPNTRTERFAITIERGAPPAEMIDAVAWLVRSHEAGFEWLWLTAEDDDVGENGAASE